MTLSMYWVRSISKKHFVAFLIFSLYGSLSAEANEINIGVEAISNPPMYWLDEKGVYKGFLAELMDGYSRYSGIKIKYTPLPIKRLFREFLIHRIDLKLPDNPRWQAELKQGIEIDYSLPIIKLEAGLLGLAKNRNLSLSKINSIALPLGYTLVNLKPAEVEKLTLVEVASLTSCLELVRRNRVVGCYGNKAALRYLLNKKGSEKEFRFIESFPEQKSYYHLAQFGQSHKLDKFNSYLSKHKEDIVSLKKKYGLISY